MKIRQLPVFLILLFMCSSWSLEAQVQIEAQTQDSIERDDLFIFVMQAKDVYHVGELIKGTQDSIWIKVGGEIMTLSVDDVSDIKDYHPSQLRNSYGRNDVRHILSPTARSLKKSEFYYQNLAIIGNALGIGVTDVFSLKIGLIPPALIYEEIIFYVAPQFSFKLSPNFNVAAGVMFMGDVDAIDLYAYELFAVPYINATIGNKNNSLTLGFGAGGEDRDLDNPLRAGMIGCRLKISDRISFVSENTLVRIKNKYSTSHIDNYYLGGHVLQWSKKKNTFEAGVVNLQDSYDFYTAPFLGYIRFF